MEGYDYSSPGAYFVTIVSHECKPIFGKIINGQVHYSQIGRIIDRCWNEIPSHFPYVSLDAYVIMPNHLHSIIIIAEYDVFRAKPILQLQELSSKSKLSGPQSQSLGAIVGSFKSAGTKDIHRLGITKQKSIWQRNYYEHIIRNDDDYHCIVEYILANPLNWENDEKHIP